MARVTAGLISDGIAWLDNSRCGFPSIGLGLEIVHDLLGGWRGLARVARLVEAKMASAAAEIIAMTQAAAALRVFGCTLVRCSRAVACMLSLVSHPNIHGKRLENVSQQRLEPVRARFFSFSFFLFFMF